MTNKPNSIPNTTGKPSPTDLSVSGAGVRNGGRERASARPDGFAPSTDGNRKAGAPSSNTAPANCTPPSSTRILRAGIDSLYLSFSGRLDSTRDKELATKKLTAQSSEEVKRASAQLILADHRLAVAERGKGKFSYVLSDNWYHISVSSREAQDMPLAYVQVSSEVLTLAGYGAACSKLHTLIAALGRIAHKPKISRIDLCVDFVWEADLDFIHPSQWVTRATQKHTYFNNNALSGWVIGAGGDISARLYNKTLEIKKSHKDYLKSVWAKAGWDDEQTVWRLEFQFRRQVLKELGVEFTSQIESNLSGLWRYATTKWLKLTLPSNTDDTQSRWPMHPLWMMLTKADWGVKTHQPLTRITKARVPTDHRLFFHGLGSITSFMAKNQITDFNIGVQEFHNAAKKYHAEISNQNHHTIFDYVENKVKEKGRRFNTIINPSEDPCE